MRKKKQLVQFAFLLDVCGTKKGKMYSHTTYFWVVTSNVFLTFDPTIFYGNFEGKWLW